LERRVTQVTDLSIISDALPEILLVGIKIVDQASAVLLALRAIEAIFIPVVRLQSEKHAEHYDRDVDADGKPIVLGDVIPKAANHHRFAPGLTLVTCPILRPGRGSPLP
jgi:hypothetical protein